MCVRGPEAESSRTPACQWLEWFKFKKANTTLALYTIQEGSCLPAILVEGSSSSTQLVASTNKSIIVILEMIQVQLTKMAFLRVLHGGGTDNPHSIERRVEHRRNTANSLKARHKIHRLTASSIHRIVTLPSHTLCWIPSSTTHGVHLQPIC